MANVLDFQPRPVTHAASQFGFGFGLGGTGTPWQSAINPASPFHQLASSSAFNQPPPIRVQKRRHEDEEQPLTRDHSMDRSPTPERPKRAAPKRARVSPSAESGSKDEKVSKENKAPGATEENDVDVGVLLASLPSQSLLPLLTSLLSAQPSLKSLILPLIPRPTLETALQVLSQSSKKLRDAYPYENSSQPNPVTLGFGFGASRPSFGAFGRAQAPPSQAAFSQNPSNANSGMRECYVTSRIRTHVTEFVSACMSYMPYFSYAPGTAQSSSATQSHSTTLQSLHRGHHHPNETYQYLAAIMDHFLSQPPLTQASLGPQLLPRLEEEWKAWVNKLDESVNGQAGMFTEDVVRTWERGLDGYANSQGDAGRVMRMVRDLWISKVGWLVGRQPMEEL